MAATTLGISREKNVFQYICELERFGSYRRQLKERLWSHTSFYRRLAVTQVLDQGHTGCVNTIEIDDSKSFLLSGSDDCKICIWSLTTKEKLACLASGHYGNIFAVKSVPKSNCNKLVSCAADGDVLLHDVSRQEIISKTLSSSDVTNSSKLFEANMTVKLAFLEHDPNLLLVSSLPGPAILDLRTNTATANHSDFFPEYGGYDQHIPAVAASPWNPNEIAIGDLDGKVVIYDIRMINQRICHIWPTPVEDDVDDSPRASYLEYSRKYPNHLLINYADHDVFLVNTVSKGSPRLSNYVQRYQGRVNSETFAKEARFAFNESAVMTGGDDGCLYVWESMSGRLMRRIHADHVIVNCVLDNPLEYGMFTSGIASSIKVWGLDKVRPISLWKKQSVANDAIDPMQTGYENDLQDQHSQQQPENDANEILNENAAENQAMESKDDDNEDNDNDNDDNDNDNDDNDNDNDNDNDDNEAVRQMLVDSSSEDSDSDSHMTRADLLRQIAQQFGIQAHARQVPTSVLDGDADDTEDEDTEENAFAHRLALSLPFRMQNGRNVIDIHTADENIFKAEEFVTKGNEFYRSRRLESALTTYLSARECLDHYAPTKYHQQKRRHLTVRVESNLAACYLKLEAYDQVVRCCNYVLTHDRMNEKALFRRATANFHRNRIRKAYRDINKIENMSDNPAVRRLKHEIQTRISSSAQNHDI